jgi:hypothetical protein
MPRPTKARGQCAGWVILGHPRTQLPQPNGGPLSGPGLWVFQLGCKS